jgi:hypothetical protein
MDDKIGIGVIFYVVFVLLVFSMLPLQYVQGQPTINTGDILNTLPDDATSQIDSINFIVKIGIFFFMSWYIQGIPVFIGALITAINFLSSVIGVIYIYDKIRGI